MHFETTINAPVKKVWDTMLQHETYNQWTTPFDPSSTFEGSWEKGSKIKFGSASGDGMLSEIADNIPNKFISIKHLGEIKNGIEDTTSEEVKKWAPAFENYTFTNIEGKTKLEIDLDSFTEYEEMFKDMWPKALKILKELCEK
jgi:uncharacterized protein YndB with AHSA1/START domain